MPDPSPAHSNSPDGGPGHDSRPLRSPAQVLFRFVMGLCLLLVGLAAAGAMAGGLALALAYPHLPDIKGLGDYRPKLPMRIYSADGALLGEFGEERRSYTPIAEIPAVMKHAVLSIEDARFYEHGGIDYVGVLRSIVANMGQARSQGASTITMQVARTFYLSSEKKYIRKIYEALLAYKIESQLSKDEILELYLNQIYLGQRAYGFAAAAETYFGKPLKELTVAEAAMLAGIPKAPSAYNPVANPKRAKARQRYIIGRMLDNGHITPLQAQQAQREPLRLRSGTNLPVHAEYAAEVARQLVFGQYGEDTYTRGLSVTLTLDSNEQMAAYRALRRGILEYEKRQVYRGPEGFVALPTDPDEVDARVAEALTDHPDNDEIKAAVVLEATPSKVLAALQSGEEVVISGDGLKPVASGLAEKAPANKQIRRGSIVRVVQDGKRWVLTQLPEVEGAFISLDPKTGAVRAMVGGFDWRKNKFNHVTQAWRQPGSSFKPFIYSAALEKGYTGATVINDAPLFFDAGATGSQPWEPKNYDGKFEGPMSLRTALAKSKNMVSIRVLQGVGAKNAQEWITRFGFEAERHPAYLTMALGAGSVTPMQMATGYAVFANGGYRVPPVLISRIADDRGKVLVDSPPKPAEESWRVIDERNAFVMGNLLQEVTRSGTAAKAQATLQRSDLHGKTGTTNDSMDAWFAGWQPSVVAVVWIGYDQPRKLGDRETGGGLALPVWIEYMQQALKKAPPAEMPVPAGVVQAGADWVFEEFAAGKGVRSVGLSDKPDGAAEEEKKSILDLFRR
ncbi:MAG: penicillin-binding protein 1A [Betaproteobacteria bacterium]|nr:penicillin-binding protein 1A [Betaproteobacteria bacterium]NBT09852.1 penicillin-binding protein 1A [Betaproteobacteria bacterium]NBU48769.1 penicillin-binding protein 1A [Betaproteobacteria bacterium]